MNDPRLGSDLERLLREVAVGDRPADDEAVRGAAARSPAFRDRLDEVRALAGRLDEAGRLEADVLERARAIGESPASAAVRNALSRAAGVGPPRVARRLALAAALLLAAGTIVVVVTRGGDEGDDVPERFLGSRLRLERPIGEAADFSEFRWIDPDGLRLEIEEHYTVEVFREGDRTSPVAASQKLEEPAWRPDTASWPDRIDWVVRKHSPTETPSVSPPVSASASRSR